MLAVSGEAFDSDDHLFEVKWDGTRALAFIERGRVRLMNRRRIDLTDRYPELSFLAKLPSGTILDGEIVVLKNGKPDFAALQSREQARPLRVQSLSKSLAARYIAFDQLYRRYKPIMQQPLWQRRQTLQTTLRGCVRSLLACSEGVVGQGIRYFDAVCKQGLEGIMAKRLSGVYAPGRRSGGWIKIKQQHTIVCAVIGFLSDGENDFRSLLLAAQNGDEAVYVGRVGSGIDQSMRQRLKSLLWPVRIGSPVVSCPQKNATWVEPMLYCTVRFLERTASGQLRAPVFLGLCNGT